ncbi:hypothetical protein ACLOJK_041118 [Asimina triloba]
MQLLYMRLASETILSWQYSTASSVFYLCILLLSKDGTVSYMKLITRAAASIIVVSNLSSGHFQANRWFAGVVLQMVFFRLMDYYCKHHGACRKASIY